MGLGAGRIDEALLVDAVGDHRHMAGARQISIHSHTRCQIGVPRILDVGVSPDIQLSPLRVRGREEVPVVHRLAEDGVGDVVHRQPERLDAKQSLAVVRRRRIAVQEPGRV
jgi:hypothetical protein